ncbi:hypothetical protein EMCRGX_G012456 [Ephydatia muelleri]
MTKPAAWRRVCPEVVKNRMSQAVQATLYILHQSYGIFIEGRGITQEAQGDAQDGPQAIQISLPAVVVAFQLGLVERDIDHVIYGHLINQTGGQSEGSEELESGAQTQRVVLEGDVCPICQEALLGPSPLTYCKFGCGNSVHLKCIRVYAGHLKITGDVPCPLCRNNLKLHVLLTNKSCPPVRDALLRKWVWTSKGRGVLRRGHRSPRPQYGVQTASGPAMETGTAGSAPSARLNPARSYQQSAQQLSQGIRQSQEMEPQGAPGEQEATARAETPSSVC